MLNRPTDLLIVNRHNATTASLRVRLCEGHVSTPTNTDPHRPPASSIVMFQLFHVCVFHMHARTGHACQHRGSDRPLTPLTSHLANCLHVSPRNRSACPTCHAHTRTLFRAAPHCACTDSTCVCNHSRRLCHGIAWLKTCRQGAFDGSCQRAIMCHGVTLAINLPAPESDHGVVPKTSFWHETCHHGMILENSREPEHRDLISTNHYDIMNQRLAEFFVARFR